MSLESRWLEVLGELKEQGRYRSLKLPQGIDFTSNDYLGYGGSIPHQAPENHTFSVSGLASRLLRGHHAIWEEVEHSLALWHQAESVLMMTSGYTANEGLLSTVIEPGDWVATDELNHACIIDGLRLCRPRKFAFRHNDLNHLEEGLKTESSKRHEGRELFIITESLFSMDGDLAPLREIVELGERYGASVIVDEAHATGCYGPMGSGVVDQLGLRQRVLATMHTGGKALGVPGAYLCTSRLLREYLVNRCRHLIFTTAMAPAIGPWWQSMLSKVIGDETTREKLHQNALFFRGQLQNAGIHPHGSEYVVPIILGNDPQAVQIATKLQKQGFDIRAIRPPTVPQGTARLRISIHADHDLAILNQLSSAVIEAMRV